jgi:hypothetical protein
MIQKYLHSMGNFIQLCRNPRLAISNMEDYYYFLNVQDNPFISTSSSARYAYLYGSGQFLISAKEKSERLLPKYTLDVSVLWQ